MPTVMHIVCTCSDELIRAQNRQNSRNTYTHKCTITFFVSFSKSLFVDLPNRPFYTVCMISIKASNDIADITKRNEIKAFSD